jgi:hypothetical protein
MPQGSARPNADGTVIGAEVRQKGHATSTEMTTRPRAGWTRVVYGACLVLFPLLWGIFAGTDIHPNPSGETAAEQVQVVADSADAWRQVHLVLAGASLLGMGAVFALRSLIPRGGGLSSFASIAGALGVAAAGLVAGIVLTEATLVAPVAEACAASSSCLSPENEPFLIEFADASWNDLPTLSYAAGTLIFSLATLAVLGWVAHTVRAWEAIVMIVGVVGIYATNTVLHGDAKYGLTFVLVASASIALRMVTHPLPHQREVVTG